MENEKIILDIVVDVQKDFITGALVNAEAQANVAHLAEVARAHAQAGHWMFFTKDTHPEEYLDTREVRRLPVVDKDRVVGVVSLGDLAKCGRYEMEISRALTDISENIRQP